MLRHIGTDSIRSLSQVARLNCYSVETLIFDLGDVAERAFFVVYGQIKLLMPRPAGRETIVVFAEAGECLCPGAIFMDRPMCCRAVAAWANTWIVSLPVKRLRVELCGPTGPSPTPATNLAVHTAMASRCTAVCRRVQELAGGRVEQRLALVLMHLAAIAPRSVTNGDRVHMRRQDLADLCGTSVETLIRALTVLREKGAVDTGSSDIVVTDAELLTACSGGAMRSM